MNSPCRRRSSQSAVLLILPVLASLSAFSQPPGGGVPDPRIGEIVREISPDSIRATVGRLASFGTRHTLSDTASTTTGIGAARRWIKSQFERYATGSGGRLTSAFEETLAPPSRRVHHPTLLVNVIATLRGKGFSDRSEPPRGLLVVGGHYDSRASDVMDSVSLAPGADDDGSGTALVLELARVLSRREFHSTIVFACFCGEEQGLLGSTAWVEKAKREGVRVDAMLNNDIVGSSRGGSGETESTAVRVFSGAFAPGDSGSVFRLRNSLGLENDGPSRSLARYIKETGERALAGFGPGVGPAFRPEFRVEMIYRLDRFLRGGDHAPFHEAGFAAVRFSEAKEDFDHQHQNVRTEAGREYGDLENFVDFAYCANVARVNAAALASLAWAPAPPAGTRILTDRLEYATRLAWKPNREADLGGYVVRARKTSSPVWESAVFTADTAVTLRVSKDDYLFGVQAVDRAGNASLVSVPMPSR